MKRATAFLPAGLLAALAAGLLLTDRTRGPRTSASSRTSPSPRTARRPCKQLIPGTEDYYYYHALHALNTEQFDKVDATLEAVASSGTGRPPALTEIQTRHALLTYDKNPKKTLDYLTQPPRPAASTIRRKSSAPSPNLPTALDPEAHRPRHAARPTRCAAGATSTTSRTRPSTGWRRRTSTGNAAGNLLQRLQRPDVAEPAEARRRRSERRARRRRSAPIAVHRMLTLAQLDELLKLRPDLLNQTAASCNAYVTQAAARRRRRTGGATASSTPRVPRTAARRSSTRWPPVHNSLKAHVLYHRLAFDRAEGMYDKDRFLAYLKLPRHPAVHGEGAGTSAASRSAIPADLNADFAAVTLLPPRRRRRAAGPQLPEALLRRRRRRPRSSSRTSTTST